MIKFIATPKEGPVNTMVNTKKLTEAQRLAKKLVNARYHAKLTTEQRAAKNVKQIIYRANLTQEQRAALNLNNTRYRKTREGQHKIKLYSKSSKGIAVRNAACKRYFKTSEGKHAAMLYNKSPKGIAARKRYNESANGLAAKKRGVNVVPYGLRNFIYPIDPHLVRNRWFLLLFEEQYYV